MANTYTKIYIHLIFSVKGRQSLIHKNWREELFKYICGIANGKDQKIYAIGGIEDHIHILISCRPTVVLSELVRDIKANSSKWINEKKLTRGTFRWQEGFGGFSCSHSHLGTVINYINNQEDHHKKNSFKEEYIQQLQYCDVPHDEKYLFDWVA